MKTKYSACPDRHDTALLQYIAYGSRAVALLLACAACVPHPGGQCASDGDCQYGLSCQQGLCEVAPPKPCASACSSGFHCDDGSCALDSAPAVTWLSPADGAAASSGMVQIAISIATPAQDVAARVTLQAANADLPAGSLALTLEPDGVWRGLLDAGALAEHDWLLAPALTAAGAEWGGPARRLRVDRTGPSIALTLPAPANPSGLFSRRDTITVRAQIRDSGAGVDANSPVVFASGMSDLAGTRVAPDVWSFQVPLSAPAFAAASGQLSLGVRAADSLGNSSTASGSVLVTRALWSRDAGGGLPIRSSAALDAHHLFVGTDAGELISIDRASGEVLWSRELHGPISGSPALGAHALYAASEGGDALAIDPATGNLLWSCPSLPQGMSLLSSPAIALVPGLVPGGAALEAIALVNSGTVQAVTAGGLTSIAGGVFLLEGTAGFTTPGGGKSCYLAAPVSGGATSAAIGSDGMIFAGGDDGAGHALRLAQDSSGAFTLAQAWAASMNGDVSGAPAIGPTAVAFGGESGMLEALSLAGTGLAGQSTAPDKLLASPLFAWNTLLSLDRDGALAALPLGVTAAESPPGYAPFTVPGVSELASTPAIGADGTIYLAAGRALYAYAPSGALLWALPLPGAATRASPTLACDGTLYLGDSSGTLSAIATDSLGLAPGWPKFQHDARNTGNAALGACE